MTKSPLLFLVSGLLLVGSTTLRAEEKGARSEVPMPQVLQNPAWENPFWVGAPTAFDQSGTLKEELFHRASVSALKGILARPMLDGCVKVEEVFYEYVEMQPRDSIDLAFSTADLVFHGKVTGLSVGFDTGYPATLVRIENLRLAKGSSPLKVAYFAWPIAEFEVTGKKLCKTDSRYPAPPQLGDEILAFVKQTQPIDFPMLHLEAPGDIVILRANSEVDYAEDMRRNAGKSRPPLPQDRAVLLRKLGFASA